MYEILPWFPRFRNRKNWTPQYVIDRTRLMLKEMFFPCLPWLPWPAIKFMDTHIKWHHTGFEYGAGRSSIWLSKRCANLVTIEHNPDWYKKIKKALYKVLPKPFAPEIYLINDYRYPNIINEFGKQYDFILIDPPWYFKCHDQCLQNAAKWVKKGGIIIAHDANLFLTQTLTGFTRQTFSNGITEADIYIKN